MNRTDSLIRWPGHRETTRPFGGARAHRVEVQGSACRRAFTLVELVAGLVLMASLLVGVIVALGRQQKQFRLAEQRLEAVRGADLLLSEWHGSTQDVPRQAEGWLSAGEQLLWRTTPLMQTRVDRMPVEIVRFEVFAATGPARRAQRALVTVDLLVPEQPVVLPLR